MHTSSLTRVCRWSCCACSYRSLLMWLPRGTAAAHHMNTCLLLYVCLLVCLAEEFLLFFLVFLPAATAAC
jgi:hypothetical protein